MTEILCSWLNKELKISRNIDKANFAREFSTGYLVGEILNRYELQDDFDQFSQSRTSDSKLNNFTRIEPVLHLLGIPFDTTVAKEVMTEKHGTATRLLYQLYIALNNKKKANLTGVAMETLRPAAPAKLQTIESKMYKEATDQERLKHLTPRQTDLNLQELIGRFHEHQLKLEQNAFQERFEDAERQYRKQQNDRSALLARSRKLREMQSELVAKIKAASVHIPKPPANKTIKALEEQKVAAKRKEADETMKAIQDFEKKMKLVAKDTDADEEISVETILARDEEKDNQIQLMRIVPNDDYIGKIRRRLQEDASAREEREKRRRKVLGEQIMAHNAQEEARREEMMVNRLMRQSQQERRIAVQLLQARHEKEIIQQNRILREKQYQEQRQKDFEDALKFEAEMIALYKQEYADQIRSDQELHDKIAAERAEQRYKKHYEFCAKIVNNIVDFTCKVTDYRELTNNLIPQKLMREWKLLFTNDQPLYEQDEVESDEPTPEQILEENRKLLLDEGDFSEYKGMGGEWIPPINSGIEGPPRDNPVVGHIVQRLFNLVYPEMPPPVPPKFPPFPVRACILGKNFSGKSSCIKRLVETHGFHVLLPETLLQEAIEAFKNKEVETTDFAAQVDLDEDLKDDQSIAEVKPADDKEDEVSKKGSEELVQTKPDLNQDGGEAENIQTEAGAATVPDTGDTAESKDVDVAESTSSIRRERMEAHKPQPTPRARLGEQAMKCLRKGKPVDDQIVIDIITEAIRNFPEGSGWILDGYPHNYAQAKLLEKALSGCDTQGKEAPSREESKLKQKKSNLVADPRPPPPAPDPVSGIDVVIHFDVRDELCLKRAAGRLEQVQAQKTFHTEFNPPPQGSATGFDNMEKVKPVNDPAFDQEQIQKRLTNFHDNWPKLEKWFTKFGNLKVVDASLEQESVFLETEKILEDILKKPEPVQEIVVEELKEEKPVEAENVEPPGAPPETPSQQQLKEEPAPGGPEIRSSRPSSKSDSRAAGSGKSRVGSKEKSGRGSKTKLTDQGSAKDKGKDKKKASPELEQEPEPEEPTGPPPPKPGDEDWEFVDLDLDSELAKVLVIHWEELEKTYVKNCKHVFRNLRSERETIFRYFFQVRNNYLQYLQRPDMKQEFVEQWQNSYNLIPDDLRDDEEMKSELHQQVDDLKERLWDICDERKEQADAEKEKTMNDGWLDDHLGILTNHYLTLMQAEVDRFQDTMRLLKDYYKGMDGNIPDALNPTYDRLPLIELPIDLPQTPEIQTSEIPIDDDQRSEKSLGDKSPKESRAKSPKPKSPRASKSATKQKKAGAPPTPPLADTAKPADPICQRIIIPLLPRRPDTSEDKKDKKPKPVKKGASADEVTAIMESPAPGPDQDDRLINDGCTFASNAISQLIQAEIQAREAEEEAERQKLADLDKDKNKAKAAKGGKKGKGSRTPSPKKGQKGKEVEPAPVTPVQEVSEEEQQKRLARDRGRVEFMSCIQEEEKAARTRLELIRLLACAVIQDLKGKAEETFKEMDDWLGARYLKEMESINQMVEVVRHAIEEKEQLKQEILLEQDSFFIEEDIKAIRTPSPPPPPTTIEIPVPDQFTVVQLNLLFEQFKTTAPTGVISSKAFVEVLENLVFATQGMETLPDTWMHLTQQQIQDMANVLSSETDYVDWRRVLMTLCYPLSVPSQQQLLDQLKSFKAMDQKQTGFITREQWQEIHLWFEVENQEQQNGFDRLAALKKAIFEIFADHSEPISHLYYESFLMYFAAAPNYHEGFLRALSVATGQHMPRLGKPHLAYQGIQTTDSSSALESIVQDGEKTDHHGEAPMMDEVIPVEAVDAVVTVEALHKVLHHSEISKGDSHRFSVTADAEDFSSIERLEAVFQELNDDESGIPIPYRILIEHPLIQDVVVGCKHFKAVDIKGLIAGVNNDAVEVASLKTVD